MPARRAGTPAVPSHLLLHFLTTAPTRYDRLPPRLSRADAAHVPADEAAVDAISLGSRVRLVSRHAARLAVEGDLAVLYYYTLNPRVLNAQPEHDRAQHIDFALEAAPCLEKLLLAYPKYVTVGKLPGDNDAQRLDVVQAMAYTYCGDTYYTCDTRCYPAYLPAA